MKETQQIAVTQRQEKVIGITCDKCLKEIQGVYYEVTTHHSDWGNDSWESCEEYDFCSMDCLLTHQKDYFDKAQGSEEYDIERKIWRAAHQSSTGT